jgi:hypothetical protein
MKTVFLNSTINLSLFEESIDVQKIQDVCLVQNFKDVSYCFQRHRSYILNINERQREGDP